VFHRAFNVRDSNLFVSGVPPILAIRVLIQQSGSIGVNLKRWPDVQKRVFETRETVEIEGNSRIYRYRWTPLQGAFWLIVLP
jgi:hypothetical protein